MTLRPRAAPDQPKAKVPLESTKLAASSSSWSSRSKPNSALAVPPIFRIPAELRLDIYASALLANDSDTRMLQTCKQISMEALPILYQRSLTFVSQAELYEIVERSDPADLQRIHNLTLHLTDISLTSLMDGSSRMTAWGLYQHELRRLDEAFRAISGLRRLTIRPPEPNHSQLLRGMYRSSLSLIPQHYPSLQHLVIEDDSDLLNKVPTLRDLASVHFTVTTTSHVETKQLRARSPVIKVEVEDSKQDLVAQTSFPKDSENIDREAKSRKPIGSPKQARCKRKAKDEPANAKEETSAADTVLKARVSKPLTQVRPGIAGRRWRRGD